MIDLREYYFSNVKESDYHYRFYKSIENVGKVINIFGDDYENEDCKFLVYDEEEAISKFRELCQPGNEPSTSEACCWFYLVSYYLDSCGYRIEQFPNALSRPPMDPHDFVYRDIRNRAFLLGLNDGNTVPYAQRRVIVADMAFVRRESSVNMPLSLDQKIKLISARNASFESMGNDEKLRELANLIENLLKTNGGFRTLDYSKVMFDYVDDGVVKQYRKRIQCFRHSSEEALKERSAFDDDQKAFLVDFGVTICKAIYNILQHQK